MLNFTKMNGAGNDFVMLDNRDGAIQLAGEEIARICDRHRGVGADGLLLVEPAQNGADFRMRYYNSDGGEADMCGNGARCFARYATKVAGAKDAISFETPAGLITAEFFGDLVKIGMSEPKGLVLNEKLEIEGTEITVHSINTGVPHAVVLVDSLENVPVQKLGSILRYHPHFAPRGTNVNFFAPVDATSIGIRTYERGVEGETLACGTGVCASAIIHHELTGNGGPIRVKVQGGDWLEVGFEKTPGGYRKVTLKGPADFVFDGEIAR